MKPSDTIPPTKSLSGRHKELSLDETEIQLLLTGLDCLRRELLATPGKLHPAEIRKITHQETPLRRYLERQLTTEPFTTAPAAV